MEVSQIDRKSHSFEVAEIEIGHACTGDDDADQHSGGRERRQTYPWSDDIDDDIYDDDSDDDDDDIDDDDDTDDDIDDGDDDDDDDTDGL